MGLNYFSKLIPFQDSFGHCHIFLSAMLFLLINVQISCILRANPRKHPYSTKRPTKEVSFSWQRKSISTLSY